MILVCKGRGECPRNAPPFRRPCLRLFIWDHSLETTFIWDHDIWDHFHSRSINSRPFHLKPRYFETCSFETTFTWDFFIWDHSHLRPHSFENTVIWDRTHLRPHSLETTFIWDHIHLRSHSMYATLKWSCFDSLCITFLWSTFNFFEGDL